MATKRSVLLQGSPAIFEDGVAAGVISPGHLVKSPVAGVAVQSVSNAKVPALIALERDELGEGIDNTYQSYAGAAAYAVGDRVKVAALYPGCVVTVYIASGQNIQQDEFLGSAGDGTVKAVSVGDAVGVALDEIGAVTATTAIRMRVV
jgi:hypothetical protein